MCTKYIPLILLVFSLSTTRADVPKVFHVIKANIKTNNQSYLTYALVIGELSYYDSLIKVYKNDSKFFTDKVKQIMIGHDSISLYSHVFQVKEKGLILLPKDKQTKIALQEIQSIHLLEYLPSKYSGGQVFTNVLISDSTWVSSKISQSNEFSTVGGSGICGFTMLNFNKPDTNSASVVKKFEAIIRDQEEKSIPTSEKDIEKIKERLRKLRIVVIYYCGC